MKLIPSLSADTNGKLIQRMSGMQSGDNGLPRSYHNLTHMQEMNDVLDYYGCDNVAFLSMHLAVWFHDLYYDCRSPKGENEDRSCELVDHWFATQPDLIQLAEADNRLVARIHIYIQRTKTHELTADDKAEARNNVLNPRAIIKFLRADLNSFTLDSSGYWQYLVRLRAEYACYTDAQWQRGRINFLEGMLARSSILPSMPNEGPSDAELAAQRNLTKELNQLL
jgi:predicted metal-dependent HD superfamily phosphohydrolase